jgi:hypothetical protein
VFRTYSLSKAYLGSGWAIHPLSGSLLKTELSKVHNFQSSSLPSKVKNGLDCCDDPYSLTPPRSSSLVSDAYRTDNFDASLCIQSQFKKIKRWRSFNFYAAILYASIPSVCFDDSKEAFAALNTLDENDTRDTCLEKCLTVAKCSLSFRKKGVLFIGAHLPLQAMHAWIIEEGYQPDEDDRQWINFLPLMAIAGKDSSS